MKETKEIKKSKKNKKIQNPAKSNEVNNDKIQLSIKDEHENSKLFDIKQERKRKINISHTSEDILSNIEKCNKKNFINNKNIQRINSNFLIKMKRFYFLIKLFIILFLKISFLSGELNEQNNLVKLSEISLKVNGSNNFRILSDEFFNSYQPYKITMNDSLQDEITNKYKCDSSLKYCIYFFVLEWNITLKTTNNMFKNCYNITEIDLSKFDTSQITDMGYMFYMYYWYYEFSSLTSLDLSNFNTSQVIKMDHMFSGCSSLSYLNISNFITSKVNDMNNMFYDCLNLKFLDLSSFDTSQVTNMNGIFYHCSSLSSLNLSNFNTSLVSDMGSMFSNCYGLTSLDLSNFDTSKVKNMNGMFYYLSLTSLNISNFDTSQVNSMGSMFSNCNKLTSLDLSNFDTSKVNNMNYMFAWCNLLTSLDLSNFDTSQVHNMDSMFHSCSLLKFLDIFSFNTSKVTGMSSMFYGCSSITSLDLTHFDTSLVINMYRMFSGCTKLNFLNITTFDTSKVTDMGYMLSRCSLFTSFDLNFFDTSHVTRMIGMFSGCTNLNLLNISNFNTTLVTSISSMFSGCSSFTSLDLTFFNTSRVNYMDGMFSGCSKLSLLNISGFDTSKVYDMNGMFSGCSSFTSLDLSSFDTSKVNDMRSMFSGCTSLTSLKISNFDTSKVTNMGSMFYRCSNITSLNLSNFDTSHVTYMYCMFSGCSLLKVLDISHFDTSQVTNMAFMFSGCSSLSYLNLSNLNTSKIINKYNMQNMFFGCSKLEYVNLKMANINPDIYTNGLFSSTSQNLIVCSENSNETFMSLFKEKLNIFCSFDNNDSFIENRTKCYTKNSALYNKYSCDICDYVTLINYNISKSDNDFFFDCFGIGNYPIENITEIMKNLIENILKEFNRTEMDSGIDKNKFFKNMEIILTSTQNQKNNEEKNNITMLLGQCENILKTKYNVSENDSLYILQIVSKEEGMKIPKIEYEIYYPLYNDLEKLNLNSCKGTKIEISTKVKINDNIEKYNPKSNYYNDICSKTTSESGTDIPLKDRKDEFMNNNMSLCEENCELLEYNPIKEKSKCSCDIKLNIPENYDIKFNKKDFLKSFIDVKNIFNINIMKCIKAALKPKSLINNYGFYIADSVIILYFISLFIFLKISYVKIKNEVYNIIFNLNIKTNPIKKRKTIITRAMLNIRKKKKNINIFNYPNNDLVHLSDVKIEKIENNREQLNKVEPDSIDKVNPKQNIIIINEKNIRQDNKQKIMMILL